MRMKDLNPLYNEEAEQYFVDWFNGDSTPFSLLSEYFYEDCKIEDEKTREGMLYKWIHLAFTNGYEYGVTSGTYDACEAVKEAIEKLQNPQ